MSHILIVEDNETLAEGLRASLELEGHRVEVANDGDSGLIRARSDDHDLLILDLMLPGRSGFQLLKSLRAGGHDLPVLILSARSEEADKVQGFRLGADGYAVKPIGVLELQARAEALLRRHGRLDSDATEDAAEETSPGVWHFGDVQVRCGTRTVIYQGEEVELSRLEFDLLRYLLEARGAIVGRTELLQEVWGYASPVSTRTVDTHMHALRTKLENDPSNPIHLLTIRKVGYRLKG